MRWLVYLLITANLIVGLWIYQNHGWELDPGVHGKPTVGEIKIIAEDQLVIEPQVETESEPENQVVIRCYRAGPFDDKVVAEDVSALLESEGHDALLSKQEVIKPSGYWVILPPEQATAPDILKRLIEAGMEDAWKISEGEYKGGYSLGLFHERNNATLRSAEVELIGLTAKIIERSRDESSYWVVVRSQAENELGSNLLNRLALLAHGEKFSSFPCEEIVSTNTNE